MNNVIALDVSKGKSQMVLYGADKKCLMEKEIRHNRQDFEELARLIAEICQEYGNAPAIVFEATGVYSTPLERFFRDQGLAYVCLNPLAASFETASMRMQKTDKGDAHKLALSHFNHERIPAKPHGEQYKRLKAMSRYYEGLEEDLGRMRSRLHALIQQSFPELEELYPGKPALFYHIVRTFPHPGILKGRTKVFVRNRIQKGSGRRLSDSEANRRTEALMKAASESYPAIEPDDFQCQALVRYAEQCLELISEKKEIIHKMDKISADLPEYKILLSFSGIGENTAARIIAEAGDIRNFDTPKQLNAYVGIDVRRYQSGNTFYRDKINKRGNFRLRKILFNTVSNMISQRKRGGNHIVEYYDKLKKQPHGKPHRVAVVACMNKLIRCLHHLITHNLIYDYNAATAK